MNDIILTPWSGGPKEKKKKVYVHFQITVRPVRFPWQIDGSSVFVLRGRKNIWGPQRSRSLSLLIHIFHDSVSPLFTESTLGGDSSRTVSEDFSWSRLREIISPEVYRRGPDPYEHPYESDSMGLNNWRWEMSFVITDRHVVQTTPVPSKGGSGWPVSGL